MNPKLQFGSANTPNEGLNFQLALSGATALAEVEIKVYFTWGMLIYLLRFLLVWLGLLFWQCSCCIKNI
ncbi:MAG: hypothetical protein ACJ0BT_02920 [Pseudohongiellaceae bacterium]